MNAAKLLKQAEEQLAWDNLEEAHFTLCALYFGTTDRSQEQDNTATALLEQIKRKLT
jgi:hypothetical protein